MQGQGFSVSRQVLGLFRSEFVGVSERDPTGFSCDPSVYKTVWLTPMVASAYCMWRHIHHKKCSKLCILSYRGPSIILICIMLTSIGNWTPSSISPIKKLWLSCIFSCKNNILNFLIAKITLTGQCHEKVQLFIMWVVALDI